jgi:hypothetical protein
MPICRRIFCSRNLVLPLRPLISFFSFAREDVPDQRMQLAADSTLEFVYRPGSLHRLPAFKSHDFAVACTLQSTICVTLDTSHADF